ncbi:Deuterolysin metalloprotease family-domain-containing protein [Macrophomina phaseolina]|uniref:Neutral protease 2 n=2 Tax=Macrophomina phaseolina TaxID=35725 RepID=A0ABQ8G7H8_9PEZI|nr:Deuterolysin metalloprotease family-domain-containing protein [Macrophomina phaseolina]
MKFSAGFSLVMAAMASATAINLNKRDTPLDVKLEMISNSEVKATVTNKGLSALKLYKTGTILDQAPVEKVEINSAAAPVNFDGIRLRVSTANLAEEDFQSLPAGESIEVSFDIAEVHDLAEGGAFDILSEGAFPYAEGDSLDIAGAVPYFTNKLTATVDGAQAKATREHFLAKRSIVQSDCTGTRLTATRNALANCRTLALAAQTAASSGSASKFQEYYKTTAASTRSTVAAIFGRVAAECGSTTAGARYYCSDVYGACASNVLAYTLPSSNYMVNCPAYFSDPALTRTCHGQDQATTTLHEVTHLTQIAGTTDQNGAYGYAAVRALTAAQNLRHADTYTLYAQALYAGC